MSTARIACRTHTCSRDTLHVPHDSSVAVILPSVTFFVVRGHIHNIINGYRNSGVECVLQVSNKVVKQFLGSEGPGDSHYDHFPTCYDPSTRSHTEKLPAFFVILRQPTDEKPRQLPIGEYYIEYIVRCSMDKLESFLYERRTTGNLNMVPSGGMGKASQNFSTPFDRIFKQLDTLYIQWPAIAPVSASTTRILRRPRIQKNDNFVLRKHTISRRSITPDATTNDDDEDSECNVTISSGFSTPDLVSAPARH